MEHTNTEIKALIIAEIAGTLSNDDQRRLRTLLETCPQAPALVALVQQELERTESEEEIANKIKWIIKTGDERRRYRIRKKARRSLAAITSATALLVTIGIFALKFIERAAPQPIIAATEPNIRPAILRIDNEEPVKLFGNNLRQNHHGAIMVDGENAPNISITPNSKKTATIEVPAGKTYNLKLSDGTLIRLNSETSVSFPLTFGTRNTSGSANNLEFNTGLPINSNCYREISIKGEAYIEVAKDPSMPFVVNLNNIRVQALGTAFNVNSYDTEQQQVCLISGKVKVSGGNKNVTLEPGRMATLKDQHLVTGTFDPQEVNWTTGVIFLNDANETQIVQAFARYFGKKIVFDRPFPAGVKARLVLDRNLPVSTLIKQAAGGYTITEVGNVIHLK
ncbi:FecR family protein [Chitinophaga sp. S165]|uniref:FecR family protein n=1 Tax=Chitinophaga sp. S165 TaxID=2135462 RepID=UPI000D7143BA|nr:FecR domain-containing protein [Chitinophaga sp. S165]PWV55514.1 FecR family protein [Chitinophaga sp. S165]